MPSSRRNSRASLTRIDAFDAPLTSTSAASRARSASLSWLAPLAFSTAALAEPRSRSVLAPSASTVSFSPVTTKSASSRVLAPLALRFSGPRRSLQLHDAGAAELEARIAGLDRPLQATGPAGVEPEGAVRIEARDRRAAGAREVHRLQDGQGDGELQRVPAQPVAPAALEADPQPRPVLVDQDVREHIVVRRDDNLKAIGPGDRGLEGVRDRRRR